MVRLNFITTFFIAATLGLAAPVGVLAGSDTVLSTEEITDAFKKQKTRGLVIVPSDQQPANSGSDTAEVAAAPADAGSYTAVEKADQVNIQISFDFDSASLREDQKPKLVSLCEAMKSVDASVFQIIGHTDSSGKASYNERLSLLRAQEVKHYLVSSCGIDETRLEAIGMGETAPFDANDPRADVNRRVEFQALG
jgi:OmpA-OmpF porin, OOP family